MKSKINEETVTKTRVLAAKALRSRFKEKHFLTSPVLQSQSLSYPSEIIFQEKISNMFFWIIQTFYEQMHNYCSTNTTMTLSIAVIEKKLVIGNYFLPSNQFYPSYCKYSFEDFDFVIEQVVKIFNYIPGFEASFDKRNQGNPKRGTLKISMSI